MAHKGKAYPVLFRRDWNLNVSTNRFGWANRYIFQPIYFGTGFGTLAARHIYDCGPATAGVLGDMVWTSDVFHIGLFDFQFKLISTINADHTTFSYTLQQFELHVGNILIYQISSPDRTNGFDFQAATGAALAWDVNFFDGTPSLRQSTIRAKNWTDPAPH